MLRVFPIFIVAFFGEGQIIAISAYQKVAAVGGWR